MGVGPPQPDASAEIVFLHRGEVPKELETVLADARVAWSYGDPLIGRRLVICTRISHGWNDCIDTASIPSGTDQLLFVVDGEPLEVWVLDENGDVSRPVAYAGNVEVEPGGKIGVRLDVFVSDDGAIAAKVATSD